MISLDVKYGGSLHKMILDACRQRIRQSGKAHTPRVKKWRENEELFTLYLAEKEADRIRRQKREDGTPEYTTIQMPYSYAVAMAAHSYWTSVFLSRSPVFQFAGYADEGEMQVLALEALHNYQMLKGRMLPPMFIWLQDVPKYGEAWLLNYWRKDVMRASQIVEQEEKLLGLVPTGKTVKKRITQQVVSYEGNAAMNVHPGKVFTDPRYARGRFQEGEFCAIETELSRNQLVVGQANGQYKNVEKLVAASEHGSQLDETYLEESNDESLARPNVEDFSSQYDPKASDVYKVYEVYIDLIPKLWKLGQSDMPEKWVFTVDKDFSVVVEARPMGNLHNKFPLNYIEIEPEGYAQYSRSMLEIYTPIQNTIDWLINSHFFNVRQVLNNQWLIDPSRVETTDLQSRDPGLAIRLKPAAYGTDVRTALQQLPVMDVTRTHFGDIQMMYDMGERLGMNDSLMGMTAPSSRRTAQEIRGDQTFGISRLKTQAEYFSATGFSDMGLMMLSNTQQYYNSEMKLKIAGESAMIAGANLVNVTPEMIAGQYYVEPVDGTLPIDRFAMTNLWRELITNMATIPQVFQQYDMGKLFAYVAQLGGIKNLNRFKVEIVPDAAVGAGVGAGNIIPMPATGNTAEPGQVSQVGPTA